MADVIIFGNRAWAELIAYQLKHDTEHNVAGFTADKVYLKEDTLSGLPVVPFEEVEVQFPPDRFKMFIALSFHDMNKLRERKYKEAREKGYSFVSYVSSTIKRWPDFKTGENCLIHENTIVHPYVEIGNNVVIGPGVVIGHHSKIKDHVFIAPGVVLLGAVTIEEFSFLGANSTIKEKVNIARGSLIGAGVSILRDTKEKGVYIGDSPKLMPKPSDEIKTLLTFMWPTPSKE